MTTPGGQDLRVAHFERLLRLEGRAKQDKIPKQASVEETLAALKQLAAREALTDEMVAAMHECPYDDVLALLLRIADPANRREYVSGDENTGYFEDAHFKDRAFDALLRLDGFDAFAFLCARLETDPSPDWRCVYVRDLSQLRDERVVPELCRILATDHDADVRYVAAQRLGEIGDASALDALDQAAAHDLGGDYEGRPVACGAWVAAQRLRNEPGKCRPVQEWIGDAPQLPLRDLVAGLDSLGNHLLIFIGQDETPTVSSLVTLCPPTDDWDTLHNDYQLSYFAQLVDVKVFLNRWHAVRGRRDATPEEACTALVRHVRRQHARNQTPFPGD